MAEFLLLIKFQYYSVVWNSKILYIFTFWIYYFVQCPVSNFLQYILDQNVQKCKTLELKIKYVFWWFHLSTSFYTVGDLE